MASLETVPAEIHFQIFSYLSTATLSPMYELARGQSTLMAWNELNIHPLLHLRASSKTLFNVVEAYCEHRLQHLHTVRPPGKGPETPFSSPYCVSYLKYMARHCTFCYGRVRWGYFGVVDFTIPACSRCGRKFPRSRIIKWERAEHKYELPLEELKANCAWAPVEESTYSDEIDYESGDHLYRSHRRHNSRNTSYVFDDRDIERHIKRRYGGLDTFFAALEKKRWDKKLELERMEKQRRWAREEFERRITASEPMVERFIAQHEEMEKERMEEKQKMCDELMERFKRHENMFRGFQDAFLDETAGPEGRHNETYEWERREVSADGAVEKLLNQQDMFEYYIEAEEKFARNMLIQEFRLYIKQQVTADVLLKYGLDSLVEPAKPKKRLRRRGVVGNFLP
jgi:hypothetical protein